ncbi:class I SAM-dependent methyltransferase [Candidatus Pelagibacter ubique]|nr:class I SAM-dependent methyltransferase [Candidatus Pelagibacter ubique]
MPKELNSYKKITQCRLCDSKKIKQVYNFGLIPLGNNLQKFRLQSVNCKKYPLSLMQCSKCNHFQLSISVNPKILYAKNYTYLTGVTKTFKKHFSDYSNWIIKKCKIKKGSLILDIGSNDGTCLNYFKKNKMKVIGIDPAKKPSKIANTNGINTINNFFNKETSSRIKKKYGQFDFITSHNVLAHTENIQEIFLSIFDLLKEDAYFCFEIGYFKEVVKHNLFDTIYHEHLDYHHAEPLVKLLQSIGFSIIDLSTNKIQGGTLRLLLQKRKLKTKIKKVDKFITQEEKFFKKINIKNKFQNFKETLLKLNLLIRKEISKNKSIYAYGSPTKASLLLINSKLNINMIKNSFEDNPLKCNKYIPGTDIKIMNTKKIKIDLGSVIIILAWNFSKEIEIRLKSQNIRNAKLFIPLPKVNIRKI